MSHPDPFTKSIQVIRAELESRRALLQEALDEVSERREGKTLEEIEAHLVEATRVRGVSFSEEAVHAYAEKLAAGRPINEA